MMNGGGVDVALAEQGFDTFKLLESLDIPYDELLRFRVRRVFVRKRKLKILYPKPKINILNPTKLAVCVDVSPFPFGYFQVPC